MQIEYSKESIKYLNKLDKSAKIRLKKAFDRLSNEPPKGRHKVNYINTIPDERLITIKPLLFMLSSDTFSLEKISFDELSVDEKESVLQAEQDFINGETVSHDDIDWE